MEPNDLIKQQITDILKIDTEFIFLMGSFDTERFREDSDIDVAVFWKSNVSEEKKKDIHLQIEKKINRDIDLVTLNKIDEIFARQVLETGRLLLCNSKGLLLNWKMEKLSAYPDFKYSRKIIEDNILTRKKYV